MIAALPLSVFVVAVALLVAMAGVAIFAGVHAGRRAALIRATPTSPIGMAEDGYREFEGVIEPIAGADVRAPLTRWPCAWYHAKVERHERTGTGRDSTLGWRTTREWTSGAPFLVRDSTGACIVDPDGAEVTPTDKSLWYGATERPTDRNPGKVGPTESAEGMVEIAGTPNTKFRYSEARLYAGNPLLVLGECTSGRFDAAPDDDEDEGDDEALFERARQATRATVSRGTGARPFILSTTPQDEHVTLTAVGSKAALGVAVVPLGIALLLIWARFG